MPCVSAQKKKKLGKRMDKKLGEKGKEHTERQKVCETGNSRV